MGGRCSGGGGGLSKGGGVLGLPIFFTNWSWPIKNLFFFVHKARLLYNKCIRQHRYSGCVA